MADRLASGVAGACVLVAQGGLGGCRSGCSEASAVMGAVVVDDWFVMPNSGSYYIWPLPFSNIWKNYVVQQNQTQECSKGDLRFFSLLSV
jgi:hypothetical protein